MQTIVHIIEIVVAVVLITILLLQAKGGGVGGIFGGGSPTFRTRRGLERRLFQITIVLGATFIVLSMLSVRLAS